MGVMNTNWMRTFKTEIRWALRVRKRFFLRDKGEILLFKTKRDAVWETMSEPTVTPVKVRVTVEEI